MGAILLTTIKTIMIKNIAELPETKDPGTQYREVQSNNPEYLGVDPKFNPSVRKIIQEAQTYLGVTIHPSED